MPQDSEGLHLRAVSELAVFVRKNARDCLEAALAEGERPGVEALIGIASVAGHQMETGNPWLRRTQAEAVSNEPAVGEVPPAHLGLECGVRAPGGGADRLTRRRLWKTLLTSPWPN